MVTSGQGGPIGFARGLGQTAARILSGLLCYLSYLSYLGYFWMLSDGQKQTWHDKLATTVVVPVAYCPRRVAELSSSALVRP